MLFGCLEIAALKGPAQGRDAEAKIAVGMTMHQVNRKMGRSPDRHVPWGEEETWIYRLGPDWMGDVYFEVRFDRGGRVKERSWFIF
jgi:hypothetical protein